mmetsp:Transcript_3227/g.3829  ORF Transcript_3227/g.3829 Transcript_3227/m.3829 type:complete len:522 (-) Transcript_3227:1330-2895(-)
MFDCILSSVIGIQKNMIYSKETEYHSLNLLRPFVCRDVRQSSVSNASSDVSRRGTFVSCVEEDSDGYESALDSFSDGGDFEDLGKAINAKEFEEKQYSSGMHAEFPLCSRRDPFEHLEYVRHLGEGSFGTVSLVSHKENKSQYALKSIYLNQIVEEGQIGVEKDTERLEILNDVILGIRREIRLLRKFQNCSYVTRFYDAFVCDQSKTVHICFQDVCERSLESFVEKGQPLTFLELQAISVSALNALQVLHRSNVVHLDVKPGNLLLDSSGMVKLCDFGAAIELPRPPERIRYTKIYTSPEYYFQGVDPLSKPLMKFTEALDHHTCFWNNPLLMKSDVWSLGVTLLELFLGASPFRDLFVGESSSNAEKNVNLLYCEFRHNALNLNNQLKTSSLLQHLLIEPDYAFRRKAKGKYELRERLHEYLFDSPEAKNNLAMAYAFIDFVDSCLKFDEETRESVGELCYKQYYWDAVEDNLAHANSENRLKFTRFDPKIKMDFPMRFPVLQNLLNREACSSKTRHDN